MRSARWRNSSGYGPGITPSSKRKGRNETQGESEDTKAALEEALAAHIADEYATKYDTPNALLSGYALKAHIVSLDNNDQYSRYLFVKPDSQAYHETIGLLSIALDDYSASANEE